MIYYVYSVMSYEFKRKATNHRIRFWSLVMVRNQLPTQVVKSGYFLRRVIFFSFSFFFFFWQGDLMIFDDFLSL